MRDHRKMKIRFAAGIVTAAMLTAAVVPAAASEDEQGKITEKSVSGEQQDDLKDELEELLENAEKEMQGTPAVSEYLGLDELEDAMEEQGFDIKVLAGLSDETAEELGLSGEMADSSYLMLQVQSDPEARKWQLGAGLSVINMDIFRLAVYGDQDLLSVSLPQLYDNPIGISGGNLYGQLENSWVAEAVGEIPESLKDVELNFYPDEDDVEEWLRLTGINVSAGELKEQYEDILDAFTDGMQITKEENGDSGYDTVYYVKTSWENIKELYRDWAMVYQKPLAAAGLISDEELDVYEDAVNETVDQMFAQVQLMSPEDPEVEFYVMDGRLDKVLYGMPLDMTAVQKQEEEAAGEAETETEDDFSVSVSIGDDDLLDSIDRGSLEFEVIFWGESEGYTNADYNVYVKDEEGNLENSMNLTRTHSEQGTVSGDRISLLVMEGEEAAYYCDLFESSFDSETGEYSVTFSVADDSESENSSTVYLNVEGSFSDVVKGQGFVCNYEKCAVGQDFEDMGALSGSISVQAKPGEITQPENVEMLFEMTEDQARLLVNTIEANMNTFLGIGPETEEADSETEEAEPGTEEVDSKTEDVSAGDADMETEEATEVSL